MDLKPTRMLGIIIAVVQIFSLLAFGLSLHSIFDVIFNTVSGESLKIEMNIDEKDQKKASTQIEDACKKLLANPIIEDYTYELIEENN